MGKLYNRADLSAQIAYIERAEQLACQRPGFEALTRAPYSRVKTLREMKRRELGKPLAPEDVIALEFLAIDVCNHPDDFRDEIRKCRMRLLNTGALIRDFQFAQSKGTTEQLRKMVNRVSWASKENALRRIMLVDAGFKPGVDAVPGAHAILESGGIGPLEQRYFADVRAQRWPFEGSTDYGSGYVGWLRWFESNTGITHERLMEELNRLREGGANV